MQAETQVDNQARLVRRQERYRNGGRAPTTNKEQVRVTKRINSQLLDAQGGKTAWYSTPPTQNTDKRLGPSFAATVPHVGTTPTSIVIVLVS